MTDARALAAQNLLYRRPELYDELTADDDQAHGVARVVEQLRHSRPRLEVGSILDLGCGTGRDLAIFHAAYGWTGIGVDLQPQLVAYGRAQHPGLDLRVGDLRTVRLGQTFDLITCLGNSLAYLHTDDELSAAADTLAAHARPGSVLIINTLSSARTRTGPTHSHIRTATIEAHVTATSEWDMAGNLLTTCRTWVLPDGNSHTDRITRRVLSTAELDQLVRAAGFHPVVHQDMTVAVSPTDPPARP